MDGLQLTTDEMDILLTIYAIMEFDRENPDNIPSGGIGEIIISNNVKDEEGFNICTKRLSACGLLDDGYMLTQAGIDYVGQVKEDIENRQKDSGAECKNDYSRIDLAELKKRLKTTIDRIDKGKVLKGIYDGVILLAAISTIAGA